MKNLKKNEKKEGQLNELALFAGAGGGILGGHLLGWRCVAAVEIEDYPRRVILQRQADGVLPRFPIWDDVQTFDGRPWRGKVDVISGGFPCQDISCAGKGAGIDGERSGMWSHMARIIGEVLPRFVYVENSPMLVGRGLTRVLGDLAEMGYDAKWGIVGAHHVSAPHKRDRIWIVAFSSGARARDLFRGTGNEYRRASGEQLPTLRQEDRCGDSRKTQRQKSESGESSSKSDLADSMCHGSQGKRSNRRIQGSSGLRSGEREDEKQSLSESCDWWETDPADISNARNDRNDRNEQRIGQLQEGEQTSQGGSDQRRDSQEYESGQRRATEPELGRVAHGVADRVDRLKAIGNGQVSAVAELAWKTLTTR